MGGVNWTNAQRAGGCVPRDSHEMHQTTVQLWGLRPTWAMSVLLQLCITRRHQCPIRGSSCGTVSAS